VHWISVPGPWKTKPANSEVWRTCRGCCSLALGSLSTAVSGSKKATPERSSLSKVCFKLGCGLVPVLTSVPALGSGRHSALGFSMGSEGATISWHLLRLLNFPELLEHVELYQFSQGGNYCFNKKSADMFYLFCQLLILAKHVFVSERNLDIHIITDR